jgi:hypothetical protein
MTNVTILGEIREFPLALEDAPELTRFEDFLVRRGEMPRSEARDLIGALVASLVEGAGNRAGLAMRAHLRAIVDLRATLRVRYGQVIEIFRRPEPVTELPPHLQDAAFRDLFNQLSDHLEALRDPAAQPGDALDTAEVVDDLRAAMHPEVLEPADELPDVLTDEVSEPRQRPPSGYQQQRIELDWYREALRDNPDPRVRRAAEASLRAFRRRWPMPPRWILRLRRIPEYGYTLEQIRMLSSRDPDFAARGFEVTITVPEGAASWAGPRGRTFAPDGVMQGPRGFLFLEYKASWASEPAGFYSTVEGRWRLEADMAARARMSMEIPGCGGWGYKTGTPWLDDALSSVLEEFNRHYPELAGRVHMLP